MEIAITTRDEADTAAVLHALGNVPDGEGRNVTLRNPPRVAAPARNADAPRVPQPRRAGAAEPEPHRAREVAPFLARRVWDHVVGDGPECPICYDQIRDFSTFCLLSCGHEMHKACYQRAEGACCICRA